MTVYGPDIDESICQKIKDGQIAGTQPYDARINAYMSLFTMLRLINRDKNVQSWEDLYKDMIVAKENVDQYAEVTYGIKLKSCSSSRRVYVLGVKQDFVFNIATMNC